MASPQTVIPTLPAVVLAAGAGSRFRAAGGSGPKVLAPLDGRPILGHVLDAAAAAGLDPIVVVVGPELASDPRLRATIDARPSAQAHVNDRADLGMGTSLAAGLAHLHEAGTHEACVVLLGDQPGIDPAVIGEVVMTWRTTARPTRARYADGPSHPVLIPAELWATLIDRTATGARDVLDGLDVAEVGVRGRSPRDIDVPADLQVLDRLRSG